MARPPIEVTMMNVAYEMARRTTCLRRAVGCVLTNKHNHILSTGYNGVAKGEAHCNFETLKGEDYKQLGKDPSVVTPTRMVTTYPYACPGAVAKSGSQLDECYALHAEWNALLQCRDPQAIERAYVTTSPCITCVKLFLNTSCEAIYFVESYEAQHEQAKALWTRSGRHWMQMKLGYNSFYNQERE